MKRRALLSATLLVAPVSGLVAQQRPLPRIGFMAQVPPSAALQPLLDAFISGLAENGYVVDRDVIVEYRYHGGNSERMVEQAAEFVRMGVALIVAPSTQTAIVAQRTTNKIPIVIVAAGDPVGAGLAASLARPGGNITGMSSQGVDLALKQLELLEEAIPAAKRVALLLHPENPPHVAGYAQLRIAGPAMGLKIEPIPKRVADDIEPAFQRAVELGCQAMIVFDDAVTGVAPGETDRAVNHCTVARDLPMALLRRRWWTDVVRPGFSRSLPTCRLPCRAHPAWRKTGRNADRATDDVRAGHQSQDRQSARPHHPSVDPCAGHRCGRISGSSGCFGSDAAVAQTFCCVRFTLSSDIHFREVPAVDGK